MTMPVYRRESVLIKVLTGFHYESRHSVSTFYRMVFLVITGSFKFIQVLYIAVKVLAVSPWICYYASQLTLVDSMCVDDEHTSRDAVWVVLVEAYHM
jgi:hypothetical protein